MTHSEKVGVPTLVRIWVWVSALLLIGIILLLATWAKEGQGDLPWVIPTQASQPSTLPTGAWKDNTTTSHELGKLVRNRREARVQNSSAAWRSASTNEWYKWAQYTARTLQLPQCIICAKANGRILATPEPHNYTYCADFLRSVTRWNDMSNCPIECLNAAGSSQVTLAKEHCSLWNFTEVNHTQSHHQRLGLHLQHSMNATLQRMAHTR